MQEPKCLVVVGSVNADMVLEVDRLPADGETLGAKALNTFPGGKASKQCTAQPSNGRGTCRCESIELASKVAMGCCHVAKHLPCRQGTMAQHRPCRGHMHMCVNVAFHYTSACREHCACAGSKSGRCCCKAAVSHIHAWSGKPSCAALRPETL